MKLPTTALQIAVRRFDYKLVSPRAFSRKWQLRNVSQKGHHFSELPAWCSELSPTNCWPAKISRVMYSTLVDGMLGLPGSCWKNARWLDLEAPALPIGSGYGLWRTEVSSKAISTSSVAAMTVPDLAVSAPKLWGPLFSCSSHTPV